MLAVNPSHLSRDWDITHDLKADAAIISHPGFNFSSGILTSIAPGSVIFFEPPSGEARPAVMLNSLFFPRITGQTGSECNENRPHIWVNGFNTYTILCGLPVESAILPEIGSTIQLLVFEPFDSTGYLIRYRGEFRFWSSIPEVQ